MRPGPVARACSLAFLTAAITLFLQVLVHRVISAKVLNNYAFLVISLTMLGFALSGVLLTRLLPRFLERFEDAVAASTALLVLTILGATAVFYHADLSQAASTLQEFVSLLLKMIPYALLFAAPFTFCGMILGALLSSPALPARRVYFYDLLGSASGAFAVIPAIAHLGVETSLLAGCAVTLAAVLVLAPPRGAGARLLAGAAALAVALCSVAQARVFAMTYPPGSILANLKPPYGIETILWDPIARIELSRISPPTPEGSNYPCLIGTNRAFHRRIKKLLTQNNYAFTYAVDYDGKRESLVGIEETIYSAAYHATSVAHPKVAIVGVGGGFDILNALYFDASKITAVEINAATYSLLTDRYRDYFRHWLEDPRLDLVLGEGRHYLSSHDERYDVLQLSGVDSYSGTAAAAHVFSENYLYTAEAFDLYLSRLTDDGILNLMRLEYLPPREMLKATVTAVAALRRAGITRPADHVVTITAKPFPNFTALLVKKTPFTPAELQRLRDWISASPLMAISAAPGLDPPPVTAYQHFLALGDARREAAFLRVYPWDVAPADDDRPFFFRFSFWWHVLPGDAQAWSVPPSMEYSLIILGGIVGLAAVVCVYLPLRILARRPEATPATRRYGVFFAATGLGYLAIEVGLLQKFGLFLGHPNYALSVVLASLLFASGVGSLVSARIVGALGNIRFVAYVLAGTILAERTFAFPSLPALSNLAFAARVLVVFALVAPIGLCLGTFVPTAIERLKPKAPSYVPWAWGINGIFSVLAPVASVAISMTWGINALLLAAVPVYLAAAFALPDEPAPVNP